MANSVEEMQTVLRHKVDMPNNDALGLPGWFYTCPDYFAHETKTVLRDSWHCLGRTDEVAHAGDYFTTRLLNEPLLVVRSNEDYIRVLSNVCRHRGMQVADGKGNRNLFVCPYHAWSYDRNGTLVRAKNMNNSNFDPSKCSLPEFACETWLGFIYVNLSEDPAPLTPQLTSLTELLAPYETENFELLYVAEEEWACNWKCLVENFMEGYHLSVVHPETLKWYTPTELCTKGEAGHAFTSYHANYPDNISARGTGAQSLSPQQRHRSTLFSIFPLQVASQSATAIGSLCIRPLAVDRISVRWMLSVAGDEMDQKTKDERIDLWNNINREDREKLEILQTSLSSSKAVAGPLASDNFEGTIHDFHKFLARHAEVHTPSTSR